ncbi:DUF885 family protein [Sorangium atrum]|uniref:DUF885 family protein n=1 Tax=Sorangium atrum TaxID=2995308 RepID=A0ABT5CL49_9BACT|nr:DUF885 family protein [Sorangium aterium]MDC0685806.1 DUF885 family protein [Sorangium aterium]
MPLHRVTYVHATGLVFEGLSTLLDERIPPPRRATALARLRRYAGLEAGDAPIAEQARKRLDQVARAVFAENSANMEGWARYSEAILLPFMPPEGQLVSLQHRLVRAARGFLDPELQAGKITPAAARTFLEKEVVLSPLLAQSEVERYTFRAPGQATSYFYGFTRLMELRREVESMMGPRFDAQRFHDFVLAQGILPPKLLRKSVIERFVPAQRTP